MIVLDTSVLVDALTGPRRSAPLLRSAIERGERIALSSLVLYEWLRGPRAPDEIAAQDALFPRESTIAFGPEEAAVAAHLYRTLRRSRQRDFDLCVAACALTHGAALWTRNVVDFHDIPDLTLFTPDGD